VQIDNYTNIYAKNVLVADKESNPASPEWAEALWKRLSKPVETGRLHGNIYARNVVVTDKEFKYYDESQPFVVSPGFHRDRTMNGAHFGNCYDESQIWRRPSDIGLILSSCIDPSPDLTPPFPT